MPWDFTTEPEFEEKLDWMRTFVRERIYPMETVGYDRASFLDAIVPLQEEVKRRGLWAAHLGPDLGGQGFGQVKLALMHEILGSSDLAPSVFGNKAPDSGNSELIAIAGTPEQKERWMWPILDGRIESAFSMTELGTGSDPRQFVTSAVRDGGEWVINGRKWFVTNAAEAEFHIVMAVTDPDVDPYKGMSMIIVPTSSPGVEMRRIGTMCDPSAGDHPVHTEYEVGYEDVRVPLENLLGGQGQAFLMAQQRLGPGRIHHCMRWLGVCHRAFDAMCERAVSMKLHGSLLSEKQIIQDWVATSAAAIESTRLLTLHAAWKIDEVGPENARVEIAMIKYHGGPVMHEVLDRAIQIHGSLGYSTDLPLEQMYRWSRAARLYDGPDEVHKVTVAKRILRGYEPREVPSEHIPTRRAAAVTLA